MIETVMLGNVAMKIIARAGALTLRELFARTGKAEATRQIVKLLQDGDLRIESVAGRIVPRDIIATLSDPEKELPEGLADDLQVIPTAKGWRTVTV